MPTAEPTDARLLVAISAHFNAARMEYLGEVMRALAEFPVAAVDVVLATNTTKPDELAVLRRLAGEAMPGHDVSVESFEFQAHPFNLTWAHREVLSRAFGGGAARHTHFVYLEDDIRFTYANFVYFCRNRALLAPHGLLPAFLRVEFNRAMAAFVNSDNKEPVDVPARPTLRCDGWVWVGMPSPYMACYILDREMVAEFMASPSFSRAYSRAMTEWDVRERAAIGLCFENVPEPFESRYVVPVSPRTGMAPPWAWVGHIPNNYANDPASGFGKVTMEALFRDVPAGDAAEGTVMPPRAGAATVRPRPPKWRRRDWYLFWPRSMIESLRWRFGARR
jgi:hypothetical protein